MPSTFKTSGKKSATKVPAKPAVKSLQQVQTSTEPATSAALTGLDDDAQAKFELELFWCIQQLELSINSGKMGERKLKDSIKSLNSLKNNTTSLIQKRQLMRNTFGDYRAKMAQDEKKYGKVAFAAKFSTDKLKENKSIFIKKAQLTTDNQESTDNGANNDKDLTNLNKSSAVITKNVVNEPFKFNFKQSQTEK